jgi:predicted nucleic acid-binding protein
VLAVDANIVVDCCLSGPGFDLLSRHGLVAPPLVRPEALSALHEMVWRREVPADMIDLALDRLDSAPVKITEPKGLAREAWRVAEQFGWKKTYDAEYVALARLLDCRLLTIDGRLRRGAARLGFVVGPDDV